MRGCESKCLIQRQACIQAENQIIALNSYSTFFKCMFGDVHLLDALV